MAVAADAGEAGIGGQSFDPTAHVSLQPFTGRKRTVVAHVIRYEVGSPEHAESFVDEALAQFDSLQNEVPGLQGSFLLTRRDDGEAIGFLLFASEEEAADAGAYLEGVGAPDSGARELWTGRRGEDVADGVWDVWQGRQEYRSA